MMACCTRAVACRIIDINLLYGEISLILVFHNFEVKRKGDLGISFGLGPEVI